MDFNNEQIENLKLVFQASDADQDGLLNETELRNLLIDLEIDESFAPALLRIFCAQTSTNSSNSNKSNRCSQYKNNNKSYGMLKAKNGQIFENKNAVGVKFNDIIRFFNVLMSGETKDFFYLLFCAIDVDNNGRLGSSELVEFSQLVGDPLSKEMADMIISQCSNNSKKGKNRNSAPSIGFEDFWNMFQTQQHNSFILSYDNNQNQNFEENENVDVENILEKSCSMRCLAKKSQNQRSTPRSRSTSKLDYILKTREIFGDFPPSILSGY